MPSLLRLPHFSMKKTPSMRIACLHTAHSNIAVFDRAAASVFGKPACATLQHHVRADLLDAAEQAGGMTDDIAAATRTALQALAASVDALLLTCSTLGPVADSLTATLAAPVLRVDRALARDALSGGGSVVVLCAVATTVAPTRQLFEALSHDGAAWRWRRRPWPAPPR